MVIVGSGRADLVAQPRVCRPSLRASEGFPSVFLTWVWVRFGFWEILGRAGCSGAEGLKWKTLKLRGFAFSVFRV